MTFSITYETEGEWSLVKSGTLSPDFATSLGCHVQLESRNYNVFKPISEPKNSDNCFANCLFANISYCVLYKARVIGGEPLPLLLAQLKAVPTYTCW